MERIFAPWRIEYIRSPKYEGCIFCDFPSENRDDERLIIYRGEKSFIIMNNYPYNPGHLMIAPYRHVGQLEELSHEEIDEIMNLASLAVRAIKKSMNPDGFNMGINIGRVAGAGIEDHIHLHIVPRWNGDTNFMPVLADVKVIPEAVEETFKILKETINSL
jgi:ATP adenylyltransferase